MPGTKAGGIKAAATNKERYGESFYGDIGAKGGRNGHSGGFASRKPCDCATIPYDHHKAQCAGVRGGRKSKRGPDKVRV